MYIKKIIIINQQNSMNTKTTYETNKKIKLKISLSCFKFYFVKRRVAKRLTKCPSRNSNPVIVIVHWCSTNSATWNDSHLRTFHCMCWRDYNRSTKHFFFWLGAGGGESFIYVVKCSRLGTVPIGSAGRASLRSMDGPGSCPGLDNFCTLLATPFKQ